MEKIIHNGRKGYFLPEEAKKVLDETIDSFKEYRRDTENLFKEVKV